MSDITEIFISIIEEAPGIDMAEAEFRRLLVDDPALRKQYKEYCHEQRSLRTLGLYRVLRRILQRPQLRVG